MKHYMSLLIVMIAALNITGCGSDSSSSPPQNQTTSGTEFNEGSMLSNYKKTCIDNNLPIIEARYQSCLNLWSTVNGPNPCQTNKDLSTADLQNQWNILQVTAKANYNTCLNDYRATKEFCAAKYEEEIAFEVDLRCYSATIR